MTPQCNTCRWFKVSWTVNVDEDMEQTFDDSGSNHDRGHCKINPPHPAGEWPIVWDNDYCGSHSDGRFHAYLLGHESDIAVGMNDFDELTEIFETEIGRKPKS